MLNRDFDVSDYYNDHPLSNGSYASSAIIRVCRYAFIALAVITIVFSCGFFQKIHAADQEISGTRSQLVKDPGFQPRLGTYYYCFEYNSMNLGTAWVSISREGDEDFLMIVDCGYYQDRTGKWNAQAGQVIKTDLNGRILFTIGHPRTIGIYNDTEKFMPTETAVAPNGDIYVADGYGSDYIIQYNSKGQYIRHFGGHNNSNKDHNLVNAHGVAIDKRDKNNPTLICTSREENCFKVFTLDGKFLHRIDTPGMYVCRAVPDGENIYAGVCWSKDEAGKRNANTGFVTVLDAGNKVISNPGGNAPVYKGNTLQPTLQAPEKVFQHCHDVCVDEDKNLYICQWNANHSSPIKLTRV